jgi:hypothetical protein
MLPVVYLNIKSVLCFVSDVLSYMATSHIVVHVL